MWSGGPGLWTAFVVLVLLSIILTIAYIPIIPGFLLNVGWVFCLVLIADKRVGAIDSLRQSWRLVSGHWLEVILWLLVVSVAANIGFMLAGVGLLVVGPVINVGTIIIYLRLAGETPAISSAAPGMPHHQPPG